MIPPSVLFKSSGIHKRLSGRRMELFVIVAKMTQPFTNVNTLKLTGSREYTTYVKKLSEAFCGSRGHCMIMSFEPAWVGSRVYVRQHVLLANLIIVFQLKGTPGVRSSVAPRAAFFLRFLDIQKRLKYSQLFRESQRSSVS